ncbi:MAG TPA: glycosyltransferase family 39 protein [Pyrinomonadaceae bacterium]|nr:glycosyltransferase family 39 protein [Pyrinomonadaceae bacterium]
MATRVDSLVTAGIRPDLFAGQNLASVSRTLVVVVLALLVMVGFGMRVSNLSAEGLSEDELNKLQAVADYREHGPTSANGEHPFLMKALLTGSLVFADKWNSIPSLGGRFPIAMESALRFPSTLFGALTAVLIFLVATELFGSQVGLLAAALWALDPMAIGFNRIAKEDTFLLFFFLLGNFFWLRGQRDAESSSAEHAEKYYWASAVAFGAMMASKYLPQMLTISLCYYYIFQSVPATRWRLGKIRLLKFYGLMFVAFVILNPTILFPATWHQMAQFAGQKLVGHDGYEFMGKLYHHRATDWLNGIPWYFYHLFALIKLPVLTVVSFLIGMPLLFRRRLGDGRYFILLWMFLWMMTFSWGGGKFTRYFTNILPAVHITAAIGLQALGNWLGRKLSSLLSAEWPKIYLRPALGLLVLAGAVVAVSQAKPNFRLYTNAFGGGRDRAGYYYPHDEFYDASIREVMVEISKRAKPNAQVVSETPGLALFYGQRAGRWDLQSVHLADSKALKNLHEGDFVIVARGRLYFGNELIVNALQESSVPAMQFTLGPAHSASVYVLDGKSLEAILNVANRMAPLAKVSNPQNPAMGSD